MLSIVVMLFTIGLLIMIFTIMGSELSQSTYDDKSGAVVKEAVTPITAGTSLSKSVLRDVSCSVVEVRNGTADTGLVISSPNYTMKADCKLANATGSYPNAWYVNYTYAYKSENTATDVINDTTTSIGSATGWFDIFVVIGAMVVLILLTIIIITSIRGSGMVEGSSKGNSVGTA